MAIFQIYLASLTSVKKREKQPKKIIVKTWNFRVKLLSNSYCRYKNTLIDVNLINSNPSYRPFGVLGDKLNINFSRDPEPDGCSERLSTTSFQSAMDSDTESLHSLAGME